MPKGYYKRTKKHGEAIHHGKRKAQETLGYLRKCHVCGLKAKSKDELKLFKTDPLRQYGYSTICLGCTNKQASLRHLKLRTKVNALKNAPCVDCGGRFPPVAMDFDHVRGKKKWNIADTITTNRSWNAILLETKKCDLVCSNCHRIRSYKRNTDVKELK